MDHHFVPRFLLAGFTDPDTPRGQEPYTWVRYPDSPSWKKRAPQNLASETDYYAFTDDTGKKNHALEKEFSRIESSMAIILREKILKETTVSNEEKGIVASFIALTMTRVPAHQDHLGNFMSKISHATWELHYDAMLEDPKRFNRFKKEFH